ncbi:MAG: hypothetical protein AAF512_17040 [Pseudomonadota bacterium]
MHNETTIAFMMAGLPLIIISFFMWYFAKQPLKQKDEDGKLKDPEGHAGTILHSKWTEFGGGFYGLMALITFIVIEGKQIYTFLAAATGADYFLEKINLFTPILIIIDSIKNAIIAFLWFTYWPDQIVMVNGWVWLIVAYVGYQLGRYGAVIVNR